MEVETPINSWKSKIMLEDFGAGFSVINKLNEETFVKLLDIGFLLLTGKRTPSEFLGLLQTFCEHNNIGQEEVRSAIKGLLALSKEAITRCLSLSQLRSEILELGLAQEKVNCFLQKWKDEYSVLAEVTNESTFSVNRLLDMEWKFGVTAASSELNKVGNTFLQLKMEVDKGNNQVENIAVELSLSEFYSFLHEMERARASLEYLS